MNQDKGLGVGVYVLETWALLFVSNLIDALTLPFRLILGLRLVPDSELPSI